MAIDYREELNALCQAFHARWGDETPVAWENVSYSPQSGVPWVRFSMRPAKSSQVTIGNPGNNVFRYPGIVDVQIFTPKHGGMTEAARLADKVIGIFHDLILDGFVFSEGYLTVPASSDDAWHQANVTVEYRRSTVK